MRRMLIRVQRGFAAERRRGGGVVKGGVTVWSVASPGGTPSSEATREKAFPDGFPGWPLEHAGVMETSMMLHLYPELVNMDKVPMHPPADFPLAWGARPARVPPR